MSTHHSPARRASLILAAALVLPALSACSDDGSSEDASPTSAAATEPTPASDPGPDGSGDPAEGADLGEPANDQTPPAGTNGITFDTDGRLWIADLAGDQLLAVDPADGSILVRLGADAGVNAPDDLAFDADGALWWTDNEAGGIGRIVDPLDSGASSEIVAEVGAGANPITFDSEGRAVIARALSADQLLTLDPDFAGDDGLITPEVVIDEPGHLNGFSFGDDGLLYSPRNLDAGSVVSIDVATGEITEITGGLPLTVSTRIAPDGNLWVLTVGPTQVLSVDPATGDTAVYLELPGPIADNQAVDAEGTLWVSAFNEPRVWQIVDGEAVDVSIGA